MSFRTLGPQIEKRVSVRLIVPRRLACDLRFRARANARRITLSHVVSYGFLGGILGAMRAKAQVPSSHGSQSQPRANALARSSRHVLGRGNTDDYSCALHKRSRASLIGTSVAPRGPYAACYWGTPRCPVSDRVDDDQSERMRRLNSATRRCASFQAVTTACCMSSFARVT